MTEPAVRAEHLSFDYPDRRALDDVSFRVPAGRVFGFLGPNGSGKTTLFRLLATLLPVQAGAAAVAGHDLAAAPRAVRRALGVAFQTPSLDLHLTCAENLRHHGHLYGLRGAELARRVDRQLERFSLADRRDHRAATLSGGLRRRVELAKALLPQPPVLLLDEPSTGLDPRARRELLDLLTALAGDGSDANNGATTVLLTTHFIEEAARCHRLLLLDGGRVVAEGAPDDLTGALGGEVVTLECADPAGLAAPLGRALEELGVGAAPERVGGALRFELPAGGAGGSRAWETIGRLARALPDWDRAVTAVTVARPDLEDVFLHHTGRRLHPPDVAAGGAEGSAARGEAA